MRGQLTDRRKLPAHLRDLHPVEAEFVAYYVRMADPVLAAKAIGTPPDEVEVMGYGLLNAPEIREAIFIETQAALSVEGAVALDVLKQIAKDDAAPAPARVSAAAKMAQLSGLGRPSVVESHHMRAVEHKLKIESGKVEAPQHTAADVINGLFTGCDVEDAELVEDEPDPADLLS